MVRQLHLKPGQVGPHLVRNQLWREQAKNSRAEDWQLCVRAGEVPPSAIRKAYKRREQRAKATAKLLQASFGDACGSPVPAPPSSLPTAEFPPPSSVPLTVAAKASPSIGGCAVPDWDAIDHGEAAARRTRWLCMVSGSAEDENGAGPQASKARGRDFRREFALLVAIPIIPFWDRWDITPTPG